MQRSREISGKPGVFRKQRTTVFYGSICSMLTEFPRQGIFPQLLYIEAAEAFANRLLNCVGIHKFSPKDDVKEALRRMRQIACGVGDITLLHRSSLNAI